MANTTREQKPVAGCRRQMTFSLLLVFGLFVVVEISTLATRKAAVVIFVSAGEAIFHQQRGSSKSC